MDRKLHPNDIRRALSNSVLELVDSDREQAKEKFEAREGREFMEGTDSNRLLTPYLQFKLTGFRKVSFDNEPADKLNPPWIRLLIRHAGRIQDTLGPVGARQFRINSVLILEIHTAAGEGMADADDIAYNLSAAFDSRDYDVPASYQGYVQYLRDSGDNAMADDVEEMFEMQTSTDAKRSLLFRTMKTANESRYPWPTIGSLRLGAAASFEAPPSGKLNSAFVEVPFHYYETA